VTRAASPLLSDLLSGLLDVPAAQDRKISGITQDSRQVKPGWLFVAVPGTSQDGRAYIADAAARGAAAVVLEADGGVAIPDCPVPMFALGNLRMCVGAIADRFFGSPSRRLFIIGVTGTNGKTTCTQLLAQVLDRAPGRCGLIGTLGNGFPDALQAGSHTTPDAVRLHELLADFVRAGATHVCMEVSSHALAQGRVEGVRFSGAIFTNLTRDHLDYHGDMAAYAAAKARLFDFEDLRFAVINRGDAFGQTLIDKLAGRVKTLSFGFEQGEVRALTVRPLPSGLELGVMTPVGPMHLYSRLLGRFNAENLLAVLAALVAMGLNPGEVSAKLEQIKPIAGRMECFGGGTHLPLVVVDYAHTPDALEKVLSALREHARGKLWCVFGCGGDRDRGKRPLMGKLAETLADMVVVTSDNPRHEPPEQIIAEIVAGMTLANSSANVGKSPLNPKVNVMPDRAEAIRFALAQAQSNDIVLLAGKGHEDYQQIGDRRLPFSDRRFVRDLLGEAA
jgi:UDP-N-acetylmuramoyl-L-alanyl-D-glutamate--2,6-diaminopimelate ligase